ncbi:MAG: phosphotransferase family protein [Chloroflexota bacterium]
MSGIDPRVVLWDYLPEHVVHIDSITGGWSGTSIWRIETAANQYAFRLFPEGWHRDRDRESAAMHAAWRAGLPVPRVIFSGEVGERPWFLTEWSPGATVLDSFTRRPWRIQRIGARFGEMQARLHQLLAPVELQAGSRNWIDWPVPAKPDLRERLQSLPLRNDRLIHLDYHPLNVLVADEQVSAILDWNNAHAGDPRADLARTFAILRTLPGVEGLRRAVLRPATGRFVAGWWRGYTQIAGGQHDMPLFLAWAYRGVIADLEPKLAMPELEIDHTVLQRSLDRAERAAREWERRI